MAKRGPQIDKKAFGARLAARRDELGLSQDALGADVGMGQQGIDAIEKGKVSRPRLLPEIASRLGVTSDWLLYGAGEPADVPGPSTVGVIGRIAAGGVIDTSTEQIDEAEPLYEVALPFPLPDDVVAFEISGDSMWPRYDDGDVIVCSRHGGDLKPMIGFEAAVAVEDGSRYLKRIIEAERRGVYNLESHNAPVIRNVRIVWASDILTVIRRSQVRKISDSARRKIQKQIRAG